MTEAVRPGTCALVRPPIWLSERLLAIAVICLVVRALTWPVVRACTWVELRAETWAVERAAISLVLIALSTEVSSEASVPAVRPATPAVLIAAIWVAVMLVPSALTWVLVKVAMLPVEIACCWSAARLPMNEAVRPGTWALVRPPIWLSERLLAIAVICLLVRALTWAVVRACTWVELRAETWAVERAAISLVLIALSTEVSSEARVPAVRPAMPAVLTAAICVAVMLVPSALTWVLVKEAISTVEIAF